MKKFKIYKSADAVYVAEKNNPPVGFKLVGEKEAEGLEELIESWLGPIEDGPR
jgi:hypothetical protein